MGIFSTKTTVINQSDIALGVEVNPSFNIDFDPLAEAVEGLGDQLDVAVERQTDAALLQTDLFAALGSRFSTAIVQAALVAGGAFILSRMVKQ